MFLHRGYLDKTISGLELSVGVHFHATAPITLTKSEAAVVFLCLSLFQHGEEKMDTRKHIYRLETAENGVVQTVSFFSKSPVKVSRPRFSLVRSF